jgi:F420-non-reducing hydrogenase iron-sulfur subunit
MMDNGTSEQTKTVEEGPHQEVKDAYSPKILGFLCNWCSYAGADLAGVSRLQMPPTLRVVRVMCSGSLDPYVVLEPLKKGVDGVIIMGCHPGDCHYISGNLQAWSKYKMINRLLALTDFGNERLRLEWVSASEGKRFQEVISNFTEDLAKIGPNPIKMKDEVSKHLVKEISWVQDASDGFRLRSIVGRELKLVEEANVYDEELSQEEFDEIVSDAVKEEFIKSKILDTISEAPKSVPQISEIIDEPTDVIFEQIGFLWKKQEVLMAGHEDIHPLYIKAGGA